jgi:hypothetical protein
VSEYKLKPKLLSSEELLCLIQTFDMTGQLFEDSPVTKIFEHIMALSLIIKVKKMRKENNDYRKST